MKHPVHRIKPLARLLAAGFFLSGLALPVAMAQGVYRIVGPDGRVSYSDQPPPASANAQPVAGVSSSGSGSVPLPNELRQAVSRYPATLFTGKDCAPCNSGRNMLNARGIPYTEKTVTSADDIAALQRLSGANTLPVLTLGGQQLKGFSDTEWNQYLDAAGYPKRSVLPSAYRRPAATPLVEAAAAPEAANRNRPAAPAPTPVAPPVSAPGGIRF